MNIAIKQTLFIIKLRAGAIFIKIIFMWVRPGENFHKKPNIAGAILGKLILFCGRPGDGEKFHPQTRKRPYNIGSPQLD